MKENMNKILILSLLMGTMLFSACDYTVKKSVSTTGELTVGVDEGISPVVKEEASEFMRLNTCLLYTSRCV